MSWDPSNRPLVNQVFEAYDRNDVKEVRRLLVKSPQILRNHEGVDYWLGRAASDGNLPMVQMLISIGLSVNEPNNPPSSPEGPIRRAAGEGHVEVVRWLLKEGAKVNFAVNGQERCLALTSAVQQGNLDIVKLLVEHGAAVNSSWHGMNALMNAVFYGRKDLVDYLRSVGAKDLRETQPADYATARAKLLNSMVTSRGPLGDQSWSIPGDPEVTIHLIAANEETPEHTLFTIGLSDRAVPDGLDLFAATELKMILPAEWPVSRMAFANPELSWPIEWMTRAVLQLRGAVKMPVSPIVLLNEGSPPHPLASETRLCGWLCYHGDEGTEQMEDYRWIGFHLLFGVYPEEVDLIYTSGVGELIERLQASEIRLATDPRRPNVGAPG